MALPENGHDAQESPQMSIEQLIADHGEDISRQLPKDLVEEAQGYYYIGVNTILAFQNGACSRVSVSDPTVISTVRAMGVDVRAGTNVARLEKPFDDVAVILQDGGLSRLSSGNTEAYNRIKAYLEPKRKIHTWDREQKVA